MTVKLFIMKYKVLKASKTAWAFFIVLSGLLLSHVSYAQSSPTFALIPLTIDEDVSLPLDEKIWVDVKVYAPNAAGAVLSHWRGVALSQHQQLQNSVLSIMLSDTLEGALEPTADVLANYKANTFVIDFEEKAVQTVVEAFLNEYRNEQGNENGNTRVGDNIETFIASYISEPSYIHNFSFASTVAKSRSGDCTEYSVLAAALARALAIPARVIVGTVIVEYESGVEAYGHAWTEMWLDGRWYRVDAAMHEAKALKKFYLPAHIMDNEGIGYSVDLTKAILNMPEQITVRSGRVLLDADT